MESGKAWVQLGLAAACGLGVAAGWEYYDQAITPLRQREKEDLRVVETVSERIEGARETLAGIRAKEKAAGQIGKELLKLQDARREGSAMVSLPALVREHFARFGIAVPVIRQSTIVDEPDLYDYEHDYFSVAMPVDDAGRNTAKMLLAVADLEQQHPFLRVLDFAIRPDPENPQGRVGLLNLGTFVRK